MKKTFFALLVLFFVSCNNDSKSSTSEDTTVTNISGVENVNGNIPDTTNTISIDASSQSGSTLVDTLPKN